MSIGLKQVENGRGVLIQYGPNGTSAVWWPSGYENAAPDLDRAATGLCKGVLAAGAEIAAAAAEYKLVDKVHSVAMEATGRFVAPAFRFLRNQAIVERDSVGMARANLKQAIEPATATPYSIAADSMNRSEIRRALDRFTEIGEAFKWVMSSTGIAVLNAIVPSIDLTIFKDDPELSGLLADEFAVRKTARLMSNEANDKFATASDPLRNKMAEDSLKLLAKAAVGKLKLRESAVSDAEKLLIAATDFTAQAGNVSTDEAFRLLMGQQSA